MDDVIVAAIQKLAKMEKHFAHKDYIGKDEESVWEYSEMRTIDTLTEFAKFVRKECALKDNEIERLQIEIDNLEDAWWEAYND